ncbi:hypothetical protein VOLCADRAFT_105357 [Volvox carteri f. nagariensis]|uniref:LisH domain-containing protein n=1 Tax=Volvox carteri f. nagariensis TaxID=3068 RepID=D8U0C1_VOLCA|nr:uncharacterized protein VOLCADRAFT_105357 [Volvox carteri f. nagariensis]EFJ46916.1 hypothetical protein VOLCADRAFT_105357 [Volvox carteri f. nagariensis]|eukprot:XP_002952125.1 hypothetical protein VOLCADRAFT_105357 [Volvox carteri f. nagariensis]
MDLSDPDVVARAYVMQWMHETGLHNALKALEKEVGLIYDESQLPEASQLMQPLPKLVWRHVEERVQQLEEVEEEHQLEEVEEGGDDRREGGNPCGSSRAANKRGDGGGGAAADPRGDACGFSRHGQNAEGSRHLQQQQRQQQRQRQEEALRLLRSGDGDFASRVVAAEVPAEVHRVNIIAVRIVPEQSCVITAAGDGCVRCVRWYGTGGDGDVSETSGGGGGANEVEVVWSTAVGTSALLTLALHPDYSRGFPLVAVGGMDGRVTVLYGRTGTIIATLQPHSKYVVRVVWASTTDATTRATTAAAAATAMDTTATRGIGTTAKGGTCDPREDSGGGGGGGGNGDGGGGSGAGGGLQGRSGERGVMVLASASTDEAVAILRLDLDYVLDLNSDLGQGSRTGKPTGAASSSNGSSSGSTLVVSVRGSNYLRLLDVGRLVGEEAKMGVSGGGGGGGESVPERLVNLNESGDDHVSFTAKHLVTSHCGRYLLVCTDTPRLLILRTSDWSVLKVIFGPPLADQFPQPVAAWHRDSNYIYSAGGAGAQLNVIHLGSGRPVHTTAVIHKINIRGLDYDPDRNLLATCSFDKTVKLLAATPSLPAAAVAAATAVLSAPPPPRANGPNAEPPGPRGPTTGVQLRLFQPALPGPTFVALETTQPRAS